jgi:uncharacterized SAM-binding protein YcdF (DUF218 family)
MFFIASKLVESALLPSNVIVLLAVLGVFALIIRRRRLGVWLFCTSTLLLIVAGWSPLGPALVMRLEDRFPVPELPASITGFVMLGGAVDTHITTDRKSYALNDNAERVFETAALARRYPEARIILSGGASHLIIGEPLNESEIARNILVDLGVAPERIEMEERSRTTFENATESMLVAKPKPAETWLLLTSAYSMPRAVASFRAANFNVVPYPLDYRTRPADLRRPVSSMAGGLELTDIAAHEWLGLLAYRLAGRTQSILPAVE